MESKRADRVSFLIKKEVADMLTRDVKDPRIGLVTITDVKVTKDLRQAHIYYSQVGSEKEIESSGIGLRQACGFIQRELGRRLQLRYTPIIDFRIDHSLEYGFHIDQLLRSAAKAAPPESEEEDEIEAPEAEKPETEPE